MKKIFVLSFKLLLMIVLFNGASAQSYKQIHNQAIVIDSHNDILSSGVDSGYSIDQDLTGKTDIDLQRMKKGGLDVQVFTICCDSDRKQPFNYANRLFDTLYAWATRNPQKMKLIYTPSELMQAVNEKSWVL